MRIYIPKALKTEVSRRADYRCEYCRLSEFLSYFSFHFEHIRPIKHDGETNLENLALSCPDCNFSKGSDLGTYLGIEEDFVRFFNPRIDIWQEHFDLDQGRILGISDIGRATEKIFKFNSSERLIFRQEFIALGLYP